VSTKTENRINTAEELTCYHCYNGKTITIIRTYSECVFVVLGIKLAMRMRLIILPSVACPTVPHIPTLSHTRHDLKKLSC
jgi:hypothetical protein